jgi:catechol 2,3-dioxygenase-like lactoylglutathione lyase family enzyme
MLNDKTATVTIAVKDIDKAKEFYETKLGLTKEKEDPGGILYKSGASNIFVYPSEFAGSNKATAASWEVGDDFDGILADLQDKGIGFESYDMPGVEREGVVHMIGNTKAAWFKDPDGNILNIVSGM